MKDKDKNKKKNYVRITEDEIKRKLYGSSYQKKQKAQHPKGKITETDIKKKLYPDKKQSENTIQPKQKERELFNKKKTNDPAVEEEIETLKSSVSELEERLKKTVNEKEQLKSKLGKKEEPSPMRGAPALEISNKKPKHFLFFLIVGILAIVIALIGRQRPKPAAVNSEGPTQQTTQKPTEPAYEKLPITNFQSKDNVAKEGKYTIQAAEYADEAAAQRFVDTLNEQGFRVMVDTIYRDKNKSKPYFKINVGVYKTFAEAKKFNEEFKKRTNISDSFIKELKR